MECFNDFWMFSENKLKINILKTVIYYGENI